VVADPAATRQAAAQTWTPFVLVAGLIAIGLVAEVDGLFVLIGSKLAAPSRGDAVFLAGAAVLSVVVTATLNLDTSVVFVTPVLLAAVRRRGGSDAPILYGSLLMANAGSLFLPGANLTNLIVVGRTMSAPSFAALMWPAAVAGSVVTAGVVGLWSWRQPDRARPATPAEIPRVGWAAPLVIITLVVVLVAPAPAQLVLGLGLAASAVLVWQRHLTLRRMSQVVALPVLVGLFGVATAMGTLGRAWGGPSHLLGHAGLVGTAALGAMASLTINNLPAAALLASHHAVHPAALLVGLNLGPNLFVTGSLAWFLWLRVAHTADAKPSLRVASRLGLVTVPLSMAAALLALWIR
jgi:arsenical pump membrane protein